VATLYPPSTIVSHPLSIVANAVTAKVSVNLSPVDRTLATRYDTQIDLAGTYGTTTITSTIVDIRDGTVVERTFTSNAGVSTAVADASAFISGTVTKISTSLAASRTTDQGVTLGSTTYDSV
jgi:hypothetical protein